MKANDNTESAPHARYTRPKFATPAEPGELRPTMVYTRSEQSEPIPPGIAFHVETALTQARLAKRVFDTAEAFDDSADRRMLDHVESVIEHLEEIAEKLKRQ